MRVRVVVDDAATVRSLRAARREINPVMKRGLQEAADVAAFGGVRPITPINSRSPHPGVMSASIYAKAYVRRAYVGFDVGRCPWAPVINFGGTVRGRINPSGGRRAVTPNGQPVAYVATPRTYRGQHLLEKGVAAKRASIDEAIQRALISAFTSTGLEAA